MAVLQGFYSLHFYLMYSDLSVLLLSVVSLIVFDGYSFTMSGACFLFYGIFQDKLINFVKTSKTEKKEAQE